MSLAQIRTVAVIHPREQSVGLWNGQLARSRTKRLQNCIKHKEAQPPSAKRQVEKVEVFLETLRTLFLLALSKGELDLERTGGSHCENKISNECFAVQFNLDLAKRRIFSGFNPKYGLDVTLSDGSLSASPNGLHVEAGISQLAQPDHAIPSCQAIASEIPQVMSSFKS